MVPRCAYCGVGLDSEGVEAQSHSYGRGKWAAVVVVWSLCGHCQWEGISDHPDSPAGVALGRYVGALAKAVRKPYGEVKEVRVRLLVDLASG